MNYKILKMIMYTSYVNSFVFKNDMVMISRNAFIVFTPLRRYWAYGNVTVS